MEVEVTHFEYEPGGKWDCGSLDFDAKTPLGLVTWREVVPGPRHGEDAAEVVFKLNGNELSLYEPGTTTCYRGRFRFPDFEPPNKDGKRADAFARDGRNEVAETLGAWVESVKDHPELKRVLALPPREDDTND